MPYSPTILRERALVDKSSADCYPVRFSPIVQERIWGGNQLKAWFSLTDPRPIGEYWLLSAHPGGISVVENGPLKGMSLTELIQRFPAAYLGQSPQERFPLLIKLIEAADDLSIQVHPDDSLAQLAEGDYGKTEAWYILDHSRTAKIVYGHRFTGPEHLRRAVREKTVEQYVQYKPIRKGELIFVPAGTLHAILKGTIVLEIQQTSDVTYRVYDWDRRGANGKRRELHIEQAALAMFGQSPAPPANQQRKTLFHNDFIVHEHLLTCPLFVIERMHIATGQQYTLHPGKQGNPDVLVVLDGTGFVTYGKARQPVRFQKGDALLIPASLTQYQIHVVQPATIIRCYY